VLGEVLGFDEAFGSEVEDFDEEADAAGFDDDAVEDGGVGFS